MNILNIFKRKQVKQVVTDSYYAQSNFGYGAKAYFNHRTNAAVFSAVKLISDQIARIMADYRGWGELDANDEMVRDSEPIRALIHETDGSVSAYSFWQGVVAELLLAGRAFVYLRRGVDGQLINVFHLHQSSWVCERDASGNLIYRRVGQDTDQCGRIANHGIPQNLQAKDVLHFRFNGGEQSPVNVIRNTLKLDEYIKQDWLEFFRTGALSSVIVTPPTGMSLDTKADENGKTQLFSANILHQKLLRGKTAMLPDDSKVHVESAAPSHEQHERILKLHIDEVARVYCIPASLLNGQGGIGKTGAEAQETRQYLNQYALGSNLSEIMSELSYKLLPYKHRFVYNKTYFTQLASSDLVNMMGVLCGSSGQYPPMVSEQEVRVMAGMSPTINGNRIQSIAMQSGNETDTSTG